MKPGIVPYFTARSLKTSVRCYLREDLSEINTASLVTDIQDEPYSSHLARSGAAAGVTPGMPVILSVEGAFAYSLIVSGRYLYIIGPARFLEAVYFSRKVSLKDLGLEGESIPDSTLESFPFVDFTEFTMHTLLLFNLKRKGTPASPYLEESVFLAENCVDKTVIKSGREKTTERILDNMESGIRHNPYSQEIRERNSIKNGDVAALRLALGETFSGKYGQLSDNPLRQEIDMGIVTMTIATRAAIEGGLHYEDVFSFCDITIRQMEAGRDVRTVRHIYRNAEYRLAEMVHELKEKRHELPEGKENRHITRCKDYIFGHLHEKITVQEIAQAIGLDPSYLSSLFTSCEHMTLKQFILFEKIKLAKNMLVYSSYSYIQIATYLGFCSQSHLGTEFKKATGMSLKEYRDAYAKEEFIDR